jgi:uncharacterized protein (DUF849 family)
MEFRRRRASARHGQFSAENCNWGSLPSAHADAWVAQAVLLGGNVRVGLEDNLYLSKGCHTSNTGGGERRAPSSRRWERGC